MLNLYRYIVGLMVGNAQKQQSHQYLLVSG